jgi:hypothetical protein
MPFFVTYSLLPNFLLFSFLAYLVIDICFFILEFSRSRFQDLLSAQLKSAYDSEREEENRGMALKGIRRHLQDKKDEEMQQMRERLLNEKIKREKDLVRLHYTLILS